MGGMEDHQIPLETLEETLGMEDCLTHLEETLVVGGHRIHLETREETLAMKVHLIHLETKEEALRTEDPLILYFLGAIKTDPHQITRVQLFLKPLETIKDPHCPIKVTVTDCKAQVSLNRTRSR